MNWQEREIQDLFGLMKEVGLTDIRELSRQVLEAWQDRMIAKEIAERAQKLRELITDVQKDLKDATSGK